MSKEKKQVIREGECRVCGSETKNIFNISFSPAHICEHCAMSITEQQIRWISQNFDKLKTT